MPRPLTSNPTPPAAAEEPVVVCDTCDEPANPSGGLTMLGSSHANVGFCVTALRSSRDTLAARVAELEAERDRYKRRGDQHWETLRSIRHIAQTSGDLKRIAQWVTEAGTGYVDTVEATLAQMTDRALAAEQRVAELERERDGESRRVVKAYEIIGTYERGLEALGPLARFGLAMFVLHRAEPGDHLDGGDVQAAALDTGLLAGVHVPEPCGDCCRCREYDDFPQECLRETPVMQAARAALAAAPDHSGDVTQMVEPTVRTCVWEYDESDCTWSTSCGRLWQFIDDGPTENRMDYCHGCGKRVRAVEDMDIPAQGGHGDGE